MASSELIASWLKKFKAAFPAREVSEETTVIYCWYLSDIPDKALKLACEALIISNRFFPTISEIRERVPLNLRMFEKENEENVYWLERGQENPNATTIDKKNETGISEKMHRRIEGF